MDLPSLPGPACVTIGNFDGVHLGHASLINLAREMAAARDLDLVILTFWPHPRDVLPHGQPHRPLTDRATRLHLLSKFHPANIIEIPFTPVLAALDAAEFVASYLRPLNLQHLVIGHDFSLGRGRSGNIEVLSSLADANGFALTQAPPFCLDGSPVSSTRIRGLLAEGDVAKAGRLLGHPHTLEGTVIPGLQRGTTLGFPTANLGATGGLVPANGVYATFAHTNGQTFKAVTNIGCNPTFGGTQLSIETFLLDTTRNLYNQPLRLDFIARIRPEKKFASADELVKRIGEDIKMARNMLEKF